MLGAGALGRPRGMEWGRRREEGSGWQLDLQKHRLGFTGKSVRPSVRSVETSKVLAPWLPAGKQERQTRKAEDSCDALEMELRRRPEWLRKEISSAMKPDTCSEL